MTILHSANLHITNLRTGEMAFFCNLTKIDTDENKAIYSILIRGYEALLLSTWLLVLYVSCFVESQSDVSLHTTLARYNLRKYFVMDFKLGILIHINVQMIPFTWKVSCPMSRTLSDHLDCCSISDDLSCFCWCQGDQCFIKTFFLIY